MGIAIVTGASSGMGLEFVRQIDRRENVDAIWVIARRAERLEQLKDECTHTVIPLTVDLTEKESIEVLREKLEREKPQVDILVNAAGFGKYGTYLDLTDTEIEKMIDLNTKLMVLVTYSVLPYMPDGARILTIGSASAFQPLPEFNMYASTKAFVVHFCRALNVELRSRKISVTCVCPGFVRTEFFKVAQDTKNPNTCQNFKPMYEPEAVVKKALRDSRRRKDLSVLGVNTKLKRWAGKLLPAKMVMNTWLKIK